MPTRDDESDGLRPWARRRGETPEAHQAYLRYARLGVGRTHVKLCQEHGYGKSIVDRWASRWSWQERTQAHDTHEAFVAQKARDEVVARRATEWEERRESHREETYLLGQKLRERIEEMLEHPITKRKVNKKDGTVTVQPIRWNHGNLATLVGLAVEIEKAAIDDALPQKAEEQEIKVSIDFEDAVARVYGNPPSEEVDETSDNGGET